jgi:hypothetical protein
MGNSVEDKFIPDYSAKQNYRVKVLHRSLKSITKIMCPKPE